MVDFKSKDRYGFDDLVQIIHLLRAPGGCPWDREQTHRSLRRNLLEESYEVLEAIDEGDSAHLCEELGDVLLQIVFHSDIEQCAGRFDIGDVCDGECRKMILRHPHVFGDTRADNAAEVLDNWEAIKRVEKDQKSYSDTLNAVPRNLPANWRAEKLQKKAAKAGFAWENACQALDKLAEESGELRQAVTSGGDPREELGDTLFAAVGVCYALGMDPEEVLHEACEKFIGRFARMEASAGAPLDQLSRQQLLSLWSQAKEQPDA